jgi:hypothetical protein
MGNYFKLFSDKDLTHEVVIFTSNKMVRAGEEFRAVLYLQNASFDEMMDIQLIADDPDVSFNPKNIEHLNVGEVVPITIIWKPAIKRENALSTTISANFSVIRRPR